MKSPLVIVGAIVMVIVIVIIIITMNNNNPSANDTTATDTDKAAADQKAADQKAADQKAADQKAADKAAADKAAADKAAAEAAAQAQIDAAKAAKDKADAEAAATKARIDAANAAAQESANQEAAALAAAAAQQAAQESANQEAAARAAAAERERQAAEQQAAETRRVAELSAAKSGVLTVKSNVSSVFSSISTKLVEARAPLPEITNKKNDTNALLALPQKIDFYLQRWSNAYSGGVPADPGRKWLVEDLRPVLHDLVVHNNEILNFAQDRANNSAQVLEWANGDIGWAQSSYDLAQSDNNNAISANDGAQAATIIDTVNIFKTQADNAYIDIGNQLTNITTAVTNVNTNLGRARDEYSYAIDNIVTPIINAAVGPKFNGGQGTLGGTLQVMKNFLYDELITNFQTNFIDNPGGHVKYAHQTIYNKCIVIVLNQNEPGISFLSTTMLPGNLRLFSSLQYLNSTKNCAILLLDDQKNYTYSRSAFGPNKSDVTLYDQYYFDYSYSDPALQSTPVGAYNWIIEQINRSNNDDYPLISEQIRLPPLRLDTQITQGLLPLLNQGLAKYAYCLDAGRKIAYCKQYYSSTNTDNKPGKWYEIDDRSGFTSYSNFYQYNGDLYCIGTGPRRIYRNSQRLADFENNTNADGAPILSGGWSQVTFGGTIIGSGKNIEGQTIPDWWEFTDFLILSDNTLVLMTLNRPRALLLGKTPNGPWTSVFSAADNANKLLFWSGVYPMILSRTLVSQWQSNGAIAGLDSLVGKYVFMGANEDDHIIIIQYSGYSSGGFDMNTNNSNKPIVIPSTYARQWGALFVPHNIFGSLIYSYGRRFYISYNGLVGKWDTPKTLLGGSSSTGITPVPPQVWGPSGSTTDNMEMAGGDSIGEGVICYSFNW